MVLVTIFRTFSWGVFGLLSTRYEGQQVDFRQEFSVKKVAFFYRIRQISKYDSYIPYYIPQKSYDEIRLCSSTAKILQQSSRSWSLFQTKASELRNFSHWTSWVNDLRRYADTPEIDQRKRMEVKILAEALGFRECRKAVGFPRNRFWQFTHFNLSVGCLDDWMDDWMTFSTPFSLKLSIRTNQCISRCWNTAPPKRHEIP